MLTLILVIAVGLGVDTSLWWVVWTMPMDILIWDAIKGLPGNKIYNIIDPMAEEAEAVLRKLRRSPNDHN